MSDFVSDIEEIRKRAREHMDKGAVTTGYDTVRPGAGQLQWQWQMVSQADSTSGYRAKLATVRVARARGHPLLLRAPLVTAWQSDPQFGAKVDHPPVVAGLWPGPGSRPRAR